MNFIFALLSFIKRHKILVFVVIPSCIFLLFSAYAAFVYVQWRSDRPLALDRLAKYKQLIDRTEDINRGLVYSASDIDVGKKVVEVPSRIYDRNGEIIGEYFNQKRELIPFNSIPKDIINAVVASEDRDFYKHKGINPKGIFRAVLKNVFSFSFSQGGSTVTQQLAKNFFTDMDKSIKRKIYEAFCAYEIEKLYDKDDIMSMYLNLIYFGNGAYGVESASKMFFGKSAIECNTAECAMIVSTISNPLYYSPMNNLNNSVKKTNVILNSLADAGFFSEKKADFLYKEFLNKWDIKFNDDGKAQSSLIASSGMSMYRINRAPYFNEYVRRIIVEKFGEDSLRSGGLSIYTTIDGRKQDIARNALVDGVSRLRSSYSGKYPESVSGAMVSINPSTGEIISYVGGFEFNSKNQLDLVSQSRRQPGSSFKPLVYCAAFEDKDITPATIIKDEKVKFGKYSPSNYSGTYSGDVTVHQALVRSINTIAVKVLDKTGYSTVRKYIQDSLELSGSETDKRFQKTLSMALGTYELSPLENATLHAVIVNGGDFVKPWGIKSVKDFNGNMVWDAEEEEKTYIEKKRNSLGKIISPQAAAVTVNVLRYVLKKGGTGQYVTSAYRIDFQAAGKTGTSTNYNDAWFVGYTSDSVTAIWMGNTKGAISLGRGKSGGSLCAPVWGRYISAACSEEKPSDFIIPEEGISRQTICLDSGKVPKDNAFCPETATDELFLSGTEPGEYCDIHSGSASVPKNVVSEE
ncbi:MAG: PBP1A family penicillin-binding protein [Spirochaetes bacterium]|nr:PBP1A family penicillin-binding protein [Spirochaetota bacterium]